MANRFREKLAKKRSKKGYKEIASKNRLLQLVETHELGHPNA